LNDLERRDERGEFRRADEVSNSGPYALIALALAFMRFGLSIEIPLDVLVFVFIFMFPALALLALGVSRFQEKRDLSPRSSATGASYSRPSGTTAAA
jgi:hypothetical protein